MAKQTSPVVHFEMPYKKRERLMKFYSRAFGWKMNPMGKDMGNYVVAVTSETDQRGMVKRPGTINGGFYPKRSGRSAQGPFIVVAVGDMQKALKKIARSGGKVLSQPVEIPGIGLYASFCDTEGNIVNILQPNRK